MTISSSHRRVCVVLVAAALGCSSPLFAAGKKEAPAAKGGAQPAEKVSHGVSFRMVHKGAADTIEGYNSNDGYDAYVKFEYTKMATGGKAPEVVSGRQKLEPRKVAIVVNGGDKFHIQGMEIKDVELRSKTL